jgi:hypothetical protein
MSPTLEMFLYFSGKPNSLSAVPVPSACEKIPEEMFPLPLLNEPVIPNDPVIKALPVYGNAGVLGAYDADNAYEALVEVFEYEAVVAYEALTACKT